MSETVLREWTISPVSFGIRCGAILLLTILLTGMAIPDASFTIWIASGLFWAIFLMWFFGDFGIWAENRERHWILTLTEIKMDDDRNPENDMVLPLSAVRKVSRFPLWSLVLRLENGRAIVIPLPPQPWQLRRDILAAKTARTKEAGHAAD